MFKMLYHAIQIFFSTNEDLPEISTILVKRLLSKLELAVSTFEKKVFQRVV